jgi:hypothetical protein
MKGYSKAFLPVLARPFTAEGTWPVEDEPVPLKLASGFQQRGSFTLGR